MQTGTLHAHISRIVHMPLKLCYVRRGISCAPSRLQFVYDAWYAWVTPDVEFPADIRRALNSAFGNLAARARHVDLKAVLGCAAHHCGLP